MKTTHSRALRRGIATAAALTTVALITAGCSTAGTPEGTGAAGDSSYMVAPKDGKLTVGFSNSFAGNAFRTQMIYELQDEAAKMSDDVADLIVTDANNSVDKQLSDINDLLTKGVDILLIDAASETALNSAVQRAWQQGVLVVSFDNTVSSEHSITVNTDQTEFGQIGGEWLASKLTSGDTVVTLDGTSGSPVNDARLTGATDELDAAGVSVVGSADTDWDQAKGQSAAADLLSANPDIAGIYSQGGGPSLGALNAIEQRGSALVPITGEGYNGFLKKWKELKDSQGWESIAPSNPPYLGAIALDYAVKAVRGEDPGQAPHIDLPVITQDTLEDYVRPDLPDAFFLPTQLSEESIQKYYGGN
ncbi:ABC transporter substrate-binding protein [Compostimonas suwonensis]|uniref:Ribose transport system substrate-binding protein n=1 Tax=Compostimonas suwonensis TaxID=1048394 RepID=A0A2M9BYU3_9MICO|nr:ABC transporter substrate-binding protein [Compostimonas suwonensis]PJJ63236.1 ribose transport system substrate-binding protein [Compostimonas suwonensis]